MAKFHVNPETGEASKCRATINCPFGSEDQHFESRARAQLVYETQMKSYEEFKESPLGKLDTASDNAIQALQRGFTNSVEWLDAHPKIVIGGFVTLGVIAAGVVAHRLASNYYSTTTSNSFNGTILDGETRSRVVGRLGKGGHIDTDTVYQVEGPDGQSLQYIAESPTLKPDGTEIPLHLYSDGSVHDTSVVETAMPATIGITAGSAAVGGAVGLVSGILASLGVEKIRLYLDSKWDMRHEKRFGLTNWRTAR